MNALKRIGRILLAALALFLSGLAPAADVPTLKTLYVQHSWFELQAAIKGKDAPALYKGAVAAAFNDSKAAEVYLDETVKSKPNSEDAKEAHEILAKVFALKGRYRDAVQQLDEILRIEPTRADVKNVRALFAAWSKTPNQSITKASQCTVRADVRKDGVMVPVSIHGKTVQWLLDTGFNFSMMSESEAQRLGIAVDEVSSNVSDSAGGTTTLRTAVVDDLGIGDFHIHNVAFLIMPDAQEPIRDWQPGQRGVVGLPVALALRSFSWKSDGTFEIHPESRLHIANQNLSIDGFSPIVRVEYEGKPLDFALDTGDQAGSQLWTRFAGEFQGLLKRHGSKSTQHVEQIGGANERPTIVLPEITLDVGGLRTELRPAHVFSKPVGDDAHHGLLGMDVLSQANEVQIDFGAMTMRLLR